MAQSYHHGDLRAALLEAAIRVLQDQGLEQLTLRKLADMVGVSRTGAYHHFINKNDLICAVAARGFEQLEAMMRRVADEPESELGLDVQRFVREYLEFAVSQPELYELMFGRTIWKVGEASDELRSVSHACFAYYATLIAQRVGLSPAKKRRSLRIAQANWATIHGLCRLSIDGVYVANAELSEVIDEAVTSIERSLDIGNS